ncbi:YbhB/YbcL family Raf kinase inhibitor-like protein [Zunongwangia sp. F363]|uniref:YbhB/YbcL family Raf kinase inhibitor-like protein n=1 Tax=Autumnicola tepida TaxID=3075595 RepID=A0ABU3CEP6_9FLAO|nr:YbhB/YbcL family Raf kinase inhibitor-like protein [Zunongwangia sp. F363]MDT0644829.1 YbhB/YbcL family Raf kinase inhibitor-like protein [Zunongwangia sp. F363]
MKTLYLLFLLISIQVNAQTFSLKSETLGGQVTFKEEFNSFGCEGENISPQLYWENVPGGTKSFAITMFDPDAPTESGWWHWLIFDIPATITSLPAGAGNLDSGMAPKPAIQSITDFGNSGYGGPCPPEGDNVHTYIITVYALQTPVLGLAPTANPALVSYYLNQNTIEKASLIVYHNR